KSRRVLTGSGRPVAYWTRHVMVAATISRIRPKRALRALRVAPFPLRIVVPIVFFVAVWAAVNWTVQVARKPTELFFPVSGSLAKAPAQTWQQYGSLFDKHSTAVITPELLAALAQMEGSGNPLARTYWRWPGRP